MAKGSVQDILREIEALSEDDQFALEQELARRLDVQWDREARQAREEARRRGIDQAAIDRAIEQRRYGS
jgi:hypothetical protein